MNRIQLVDLDMSSDEEDTGGMVILKHEMRNRLEWCSTRVEPQMKQETETTDTIKEVEKIHEVVWIQDTQENQLEDALTSIDTLKVMDLIKDDCGEINKEQKNVTKKQEVEQLATTEVSRDIETTEAEPQESSMPVEENEEGMLPEDGILLTYIFKRKQKDHETEAVDSPARPEVKAAEYTVDILMSGDNHRISENSQKSHEMKKLVEDIAVILLTSQPVMKDEEILEEEPMESQPVRMTMVDKLANAVNNLGKEIKNEESLKIPAIDLMLQIQAACDECNLFPKNTTVDILDIMNMIPDKSVLAWKEKLNGNTEINT